MTTCGSCAELQEAIDHLVAACETHWKDAPTEACICPGCTRSVPVWWVSGLCFDCAAADCDCDGAPGSMRPIEPDSK